MWAILLVAVAVQVSVVKCFMCPAETANCSSPLDTYSINVSEVRFHQTTKINNVKWTTDQSFSQNSSFRAYVPSSDSKYTFNGNSIALSEHNVQSSEFKWKSKYESRGEKKSFVSENFTFGGRNWMWEINASDSDALELAMAVSENSKITLTINTSMQVLWKETGLKNDIWSVAFTLPVEKFNITETLAVGLGASVQRGSSYYSLYRVLMIGDCEISLNIKRRGNTDYSSLPDTNVTLCSEGNECFNFFNFDRPQTSTIQSFDLRDIRGIINFFMQTLLAGITTTNVVSNGNVKWSALYEGTIPHTSHTWMVELEMQPPESATTSSPINSEDSILKQCLKKSGKPCMKIKKCTQMCEQSAETADEAVTKDQSQKIAWIGTLNSASVDIDVEFNERDVFWANANAALGTANITQTTPRGTYEWNYSFPGPVDELLGSLDVCLHWGTGEKDLFTSYVAQSYPNPLSLLSTRVGVQKTSGSSDNQLDVRADIKLCGNVRMQCTNNTVSPLSVVCELHETTSTLPSSTVISSRTASTSSSTTESTTVSVPSVPTTSPTTATTTEMSTSPQQTSPNSSSPVSFGDTEAVRSSSPLPIAVGVAVPVVLIIVVATLVVIILRRRRLACFGSGRRSPRPYDNPGYEFNNSDNTISGVANDVERNDPATGYNNRTNTEASDSSQGASDYYSVIRDSEINPSDAAFRPMESLYKLAKGHHTDTAMTNAGAGKSGAAAGNINGEDDSVPPELPPKKRHYASLEDLSASADHLYSGLSPTYQSSKAGPHAESQGEGVYHILEKEPSGATRDAGIDTEEGREGIYHIPNGDAGKSVYHVLDDDPDDIYHTPKSNAAAKPKSLDQKPTEGGVYHILEKEPATSDQAKGAGIYHILEEDPSTTKKTPQHGHNVYHTLEKEEDTSAGGDYFTLEEDNSETHNPDVAKPEDSDYNSLDFDRKGKNVQRCSDDQEEAAVYSHLQSGDEDDYNELERNRKERTIDEDYSHLQQ